MDNGFPRERASGSGGGPVSGSSPPSAFPESDGYASDSQSLLLPAPHTAAAQDEVPRWQEVADAVWLAAYWDRHGGPAVGVQGAGQRDDGGSAAGRPGSAGKAGTRSTAEAESAATGESGPTDTGEAGRTDTGEAECTREPRDAASTDQEADGAPSSAGPRAPVPAGERDGRPSGDLADGPYVPDPLDVLPDHAPEPPGGGLLPDPEGSVTLHLAPPLLAEDANEPQHGPGRRTAQLARALHQLQRRVSSRDAHELDEEATAEQGIADGLWLPFLRPARTTAFDLVLLADDAPTMRIWEETVARLAEAAEHSGAFRSVRTVRVVVPRTGSPTLHWTSGGAVADPAELIDGRGGRVFLVVTDGLGHGWAAPAADTLLGRLAHAGPTALVHLLPPHLRHRSSLYPHPAVLEAGGFGAANDALGHWAPPGGPDPMRPLPEAGDDSLPVPVLSLKPASIAAWADLVTGDRGVRRSLPVVLAGNLTKGAPAPGLRAPRFPRAAAAAVRRFFTLATPKARRLATQLAAVPFEFELVEQLRRKLMPDTGPDHVAEILMGGLIDWNGAGEGRPEFADGVREALLAATTRTQLARTVSVVGDLPAAGERGMALRAALRDPVGTTLPDPAEAGWVRSELAVMRALSGPYSDRANRIHPDPLRRTPGGGTERSPDLPASTPQGMNNPEGVDSRDDQAGSHPASDHPDSSGDPLPTPVTETHPEAPEAEQLMQSTTTATPALLVNVPLRNTSFVGRQALLRAVEEQLGAQDTAAVLPHALHGLGGVGKSQLALEYIYTHQHEYSVICWIPAERESLILAALAHLADALGVAPAGHDSAGGAPAANAAVPAVLEALRSGSPYRNWLLVFDNAEEIDTVRRYFPANGPGKVIVTSRNRAWERVATPLPVNVFDREESIELLQKRSPDLSTEDADRLAEALGDLPLAIEQAGAWRAVTGMLVDEYLDLLAQRSPEILELDPAPDYPVSVAAAWDISLERIKERNPGARQLLDICAAMAPEPIPRSMLRGSRGVNITPEVDPLLRESIKLNRAVRDLSQFSLVKVDPRSDTLQMHRLLQTVLLAKLDREQHERMRDAAHQLLSAAKPGNYASSLEWRSYQLLLPHILASQAVTSTDTYVRELVYDTALFLYYWGDHEGAVDLARQAYNAWLAASGEEDIHVIRIAKSLAFTLRQVGQIAEAIPLTEKALEVSRRSDDVDAEDLIDSLCEMADARRYQGRFAEARDLGKEATELARSLMGPDDPMTLRATHSWAVDLRLCGQFREALELDQENARLRELMYGPASFFTLNTLNGLSIDMRESGDFPGAREFQEDVHRRARSAMGEEHPLTLRVARNLAVCLRRDGALDEAVKLSEETLRRFLSRYGPLHADSLASALNLSVDRRLAGDLERSLEQGEDTARRYATLFGDDHAYTLMAQANVAATLRALGRLDQAHEMEEAAAGRLSDTLGAEHVTTLTVALGQASTAYAQLDFDRAHALDKANLPRLEEVAGEEHPLTFACRANLSMDLRGLGRGDEADEEQRTAVEGFTRMVRPDHPWLVAARHRRRIDVDLAPMPL
ncbi:tetratricopeptide repeat protein [Streptomyces sp. SBST2-5]|uniref:Tetratricopeptide repeat protein n=1 Tax=Streptomyces composti TaxID=2720025 RepID=A0ABX1AAW0_9ACTN|nr:tetratricopeptide repeat protein [Streptomyces composti]